MEMRPLNIFSGAIALATVLSLTGAPAWAQNTVGQENPSAPQSRSDVIPCSLAGVNPADHADVFANPEVAKRDYGFVKGADGNWQVIPNCRQTVGKPN